MSRSLNSCLRPLPTLSIAAAALFGGAMLLFTVAQAPEARAMELQSVNSCAVGMRVATRDGHAGTITRIDRDWSYCYVRQDDSGKEVGYLYSLLDTASGNDKTNGAPHLAVGVYECVGNGTLFAGRVRITGPKSYSVDRGAGQYRIENSGKIVFETGPLKSLNSKLLSNGRIGLNSDGDNFYATACDFNPHLR